jgi:DNA-binding MarR family transcriptional regulator
MDHPRVPPPDSGDEPDWHLLMEKLLDLEARLADMPQIPPSTVISDKKLAIIASSIYRARRRRLNYFDQALFAEPAWDMLLDLFANRALGRRVNITSLCLAADVPQSTGLRYIAQLEEHGLLERSFAPEDRRVTLVDLTPLGYKQMRRYVVDGIGRFDLPNPE